eukprot:519122-Amphidinium_carterae.1
MDQSIQSMQSMLLITLGVIPLLSALNVAASQKVMSEISQKIKKESEKGQLEPKGVNRVSHGSRAGHVQGTQQSRHQRSQTQCQGLPTSE